MCVKIIQHDIYDTYRCRTYVLYHKCEICMAYVKCQCINFGHLNIFESQRKKCFTFYENKHFDCFLTLSLFQQYRVFHIHILHWLNTNNLNTNNRKYENYVCYKLLPIQMFKMVTITSTAINKSIFMLAKHKFSQQQFYFLQIAFFFPHMQIRNIALVLK